MTASEGKIVRDNVMSIFDHTGLSWNGRFDESIVLRIRQEDFSRNPAGRMKMLRV